MNQTSNFDVTVSVWNDFHAIDLCAGLAASGYKVLALRSENTTIPSTLTRCCESARILTRIYQRTQKPFFLELAQNTFERFARKNVGQSKIFWGWNSHHLSAFEQALTKNQRVICERGSTHGRWATRRLNQVHRDLGWGETNLELRTRDVRALREYSLAEHIVIPSQFVRKTFIEEGVPEQKLKVNPYGVDTRHWSKVEGRERDKDPLIFIFTAAVSPRKGAHILLRAWEKAALKNAELWFCGGVHFPIEKLCLPVTNTVKFLGFTSHADLAKYYERASVYVLPSFEEGMARSGLEALAAGLPLLVTEETGLTDIFQDGEEGLLVPSGDVDTLVESLRWYSNHREKIAGMSHKARAKGLQMTREAYGARAASMLRGFLIV